MLLQLHCLNFIKTMNVTESFMNEFNYTTSEVSLPMKAEAYVAVVIILILIGVFGFTLNLFVIILMWKDKQLWTPLNMVLFNLVCSDFSVSIFGNPWTLSSAVYQRWIFGKIMCKIYGFFMSLLGITSITTLAVLAFERYIIIAKPFHSFKIARREALISILLIWIYSSILTIPPLIGWGDYISEGANISCSVNWEDQSYHTMTYIVFLFIFGLAIPVFIITFSYVNIILTMKTTNLRTGRVSKSEGRITTMILMMIITFLVAWSPYAIVALIIQFGDAKLITPALGVIPALLAKSSICYNPIIYVGMNTQFRQSWKQVFGKPEQSETKSGMMLHTIFSNTSVRNVTYIKSEFYNNEFQTTVINNEGDIDNVQYELINLSDNVTDNINPLIVNTCNGDSERNKIATIEEKNI